MNVVKTNENLISLQSSKPANEIETLFKDKEYCFTEIRRAREIFTSSTYTLEKADRLIKGLALMLLYCPEEIYYQVLSSIEEADIRSQYTHTKKTSVERIYGF